MALARLYRVTDTYGQRWHVAAPSFSEAIERMREWENEPYADVDEVVRAVEVAEDLILDGTRDDSVGHSYGVMPVAANRPATDWLLVNNIVGAAEILLAMCTPTAAISVTNILARALDAATLSDALRRIEALRNAVEKYQEIPF